MSTPIDPRILNLSYSSLLELHSCPRRFQLQKLNAQEDANEDFEASVTFSFGTVVGLGIQSIFQKHSEEDVLFQMFLAWEPDLFSANPKQVKSFWHAIHAVQKFYFLQSTGLLQDWELVYHDGKPATELSFVISFPDGFRYRGFVDAVLSNKTTGKVMVLECKTSSASNLNPASYKNSAQAVGYSIVLDNLFPDLSAYEVLYLVYTTKNQEYNLLPFDKSYHQRALWIQELLLDIEVIKLYETTGVYPMHGESCLPFYRECQFLQTCTLGTDLITTAESEESRIRREEKESQYQIKVSIQDLIEIQLAKGEL